MADYKTSLKIYTPTSNWKFWRPYQGETIEYAYPTKCDPCSTAIDVAESIADRNFGNWDYDTNYDLAIQHEFSGDVYLINITVESIPQFTGRLVK